MRVLITGGYGCIGAWVVRKLIDRGVRDIWVYDVAYRPKRLELILAPDELSLVRHEAGDVTDLDRLTETLRENRIDRLLHLAALQVPFCQADPRAGARVNVLGTVTVFEAVRRLMPQLKQIVYASSVAVYGPQEAYPERPVPERVPLLPTTLYGGYKVCNELNARVYAADYGVASVGLRPWAVYGVGRDQGLTSGPTKAIKAVVVGRPYHIGYGGWQALQYVEDVAELFVRFLEAELEGAAVYNLRGSVVTMDQFLAVLTEVDSRAEQLISYEPVQLGIAYDLDDRSLCTALPDFAYTPLEEGVRRTYEHFRTLYAEGRLPVEDLET